MSHNADCYQVRTYGEDAEWHGCEAMVNRRCWSCDSDYQRRCMKFPSPGETRCIQHGGRPLTDEERRQQKHLNAASSRARIWGPSKKKPEYYI